MEVRKRKIISQKGQTLIEFPIVLFLLFLPLALGVMEFGRALYVWNTIAEATRRGTRLAVVSGFEGGDYNPTEIENIKNWTIFGKDGTASSILTNLTTNDVAVEYLDRNHAATTTYENVRYVRVGITNYKFKPVLCSLLNLPLEIPIPSFSTTLPRESLGIVPKG
jgi:hypothetical protein